MTTKTTPAKTVPFLRVDDVIVNGFTFMNRDRTRIDVENHADIRYFEIEVVRNSSVMVEIFACRRSAAHPEFQLRSLALFEVGHPAAVTVGPYVKEYIANYLLNFDYGSIYVDLTTLLKNHNRAAA